MKTQTADWTDYDAMAKLAANNHADFDSFAWHAEPDDGENWTLVYTDNRDSGPIDRANAQSIAAELAKYEDDVRSERHNHFACGWVDGFAIRVYDESGEVTAAFRAYCDLQARLDDYPVLDEELLSELEIAECDDAWENYVASDFQRGLERAFNVDDLDIDGDKLRELFDDAGGRIEHTGSETIADIDSAVSNVTADMLRPFVPKVRVRVYRDGLPLVDGWLQLDEYTVDMPLYEPEFDACMAADDNGDESVTIDGRVYTWETN